MDKLQEQEQLLLDGGLGVGTSSGKRRRGVKRAELEAPKLPEGEITADDAFKEIFWPEYPRKVNRFAAEKAWKHLKIRDDDDATVKSIMAGLRRDKTTEWRDREISVIPHASTWLNQRRWEG